ncbi:MAG: MFS transporter [Anaerolineae bacterium]
MSAEQPDIAAAQAIASAHARRNFAMLATDYGAFALGWTFASTSTILPAFAERLGATNLMIGAIPAALTLGYTLPPLFAANYTERLSRKLPTILFWTTFERIPLLLLAIVAYLFAERSPAVALAAVLISLLSMSGAGGALMPAWMDLIGKVIPSDRRGRMFATGSVLGSGLGLVGTALSGYYLRAFPFPDSYALCFVTGFLCLLASWVCLALVVEPPVHSRKPHVGMLVYMRRLPDVLRRDHSFAWYLVYRCVAQLGGMAGAFYAVYALRTLGAPMGIVAQYTTVLLAGQAVANLGLGWLADRIGHRPILVLGTALAVLGNAIAFLAHDPGMLFAVFACVGASTAAGNVSILNISIEFAPDEDRPTYVGLASTVTAPLAVAASLIGGALADASGYPAVFAAAAVISLLAGTVLLLRVRDPRRRSSAAPVGEQSAEG